MILEGDSKHLCQPVNGVWAGFGLQMVLNLQDIFRIIARHLGKLHRIPTPVARQ